MNYSALGGRLERWKNSQKKPARSTTCGMNAAWNARANTIRITKDRQKERDEVIARSARTTGIQWNSTPPNEGKCPHRRNRSIWRTEHASVAESQDTWHATAKVGRSEA